MTATTQQKAEPIAIIGSGCRFPGGASSPSRLWSLLKEPRDVLDTIPSSRFNPEGFYHADGTHHGATNIKYAYTLAEDASHFDASFFGIKPVEADAMDPQHRLLLETVYEALEAAGIPLEALRGSDTACYVGQMCNDYNDHLLRDFDAIPMYFATGVSRAITSNRVSYFFDWHGPSMTIDTACSSSLVALHQGVQSLRSGESRVAVAAGVNLLLGPEWFVSESKLKMLSPEGRSRMWSEDANGYARGEGIVSVILKPLSDALRDGDDIECVIRETGVNQDGKTNGITVPSSEAQKQLILDTYRRAGLDPYEPADRCQYFEAHGTGTQAGDPREARAVSEAFFRRDDAPTSDKLLVGSIKTLIGHTEGAAGLAGVLKASLALQHGLVTPNLHFNQLNPAVEPFYGHLHIPTAVTPWPAVAPGQPRRASVNSFGFGGTNAHAILESFEPSFEPSATSSDTSGLPNFMPAVLSASSEKSLQQGLAALLAHLDRARDAGDAVDVRSLCKTLLQRSLLQFRVALPACSLATLRARLEAAVHDSSKAIRAAPPPDRDGLLGIFTGQGAQWAAMGRHLVLSAPAASRTIALLEQSLATLPEADRPAWSLREELLAGPQSSRLSEAALAQPLCTAVQVMLVDLLLSAGVRFAAVVGHSSGEIGAAYAAGFLRAHDAIRIAYYRGVHAKRAGSRGLAGAMLAAGMDFASAQDLCEQAPFRGRLAVAASNSSSSVTLAGDADAVDEAKALLDQRKTFARRLLVDTAYHSHHMRPCADAYTASLRACQIQIQVPVPVPGAAPTQWFSSVHGGRAMAPADPALAHTYWRDNMVHAVLFSHALQAALDAAEGPFRLAVEVGPHPALRGPASQTLAEAGHAATPYTGLLSRGAHDVEALVDGLGAVWAQSRSRADVDLAALHGAATAGAQPAPRLVKGLPPYAWQHDRSHWHESRYARAFRTKAANPHELLGTLVPDGVDQELRWRNLLSVKEIPWLAGHALQGSTIFPAAGYASAAFESAMRLADARPVQWLELEGLDIQRALIFADDAAAVETLVTLTHVEQPRDGRITARFRFYSSPAKNAARLALNATAAVHIALGDQPLQVPADGRTDAPCLLPLDTDRFYQKLADLGYQYSGLFRGLSAMKRWTDTSIGLIHDAPAAASSSSSSSSSRQQAPMIHPATLDLAIQALFSAHGSPGDGRLWDLHVPKTVAKIGLNPHLCAANRAAGQHLPFTVALRRSPGGSGIRGHVDVLAADQRQLFFQLEDVQLVPISEATAPGDRLMFAHTVWQPQLLDHELAVPAAPTAPLAQAADLAMERACEQSAARHLRAHRRITPAPAADGPPDQTAPALLDLLYARLDQTHEEQSPAAADTDKASAAGVDVQLVASIGAQLAQCLDSGAGNALLPPALVTQWLDAGLQLRQAQDAVAAAVGSIAHESSGMDVVEFGRGSRAMTRAILQALAATSTVASYTAHQLPAEALAELVDALELRPDAVSVGHAHLHDRSDSDAAKADLVVVSDPMLLVAPDAAQVVGRLAQMLRPGGRLVLLAVSPAAPLRTLLAAAALGHRDGAAVPTVPTALGWDRVLRQHGFTGVDAHATLAGGVGGVKPFALYVSQRADELTLALRDPLHHRAGLAALERVVIVGGGASLETAKLAKRVAAALASHCDAIESAGSLAAAAALDLTGVSAVLFLDNLEQQADGSLAALSQAQMDGLKLVCEHAATLLWVTRGAVGGVGQVGAAHPDAAVALGLARTLRLEYPQLTLQSLDTPPAAPLVSPTLLAESLLRLVLLAADGSRPIEPELAWRDDRLLVPRIRPLADANRRYNAARRRIARRVDARALPVRLEHHDHPTRASLVAAPAPPASTLLQDQAVVQVEHVSLFAAPVDGRSRLHVFSGVVQGSGQPVLGLAAQCASLVAVPAASLLHLTDARCSPQTLRSVFSLLVAADLLDEVAPGSTLVLHDAGSLTPAVIALAAEQRKTVICTTSISSSAHPEALLVGLESSRRRLESHIPRHAAAIVDLSLDSHGHAVARRIADSIGSAARLVSPQTRQAHLHASLTPTKIRQVLQDAWQEALRRPDVSSAGPLDTLTAPAVAAQDSLPRSLDATVDWAAEPVVSVPVVPVDDSDALFRPDRTYILFGLTSTIGLSLAQWMVEHGAKHLVLASRNASIDKTWRCAMRRKGAQVHVMPCDVTTKASVLQLYRHVKAEMPPPGGLVNGTMILRDTRFADMTVDQWDAATRPKIQGSIHMDDVFAAEDLDFFIMFSSITAVSGSVGQANYTAANSFMSGLAAQRRARGQPASVIDLGVVSGIGYLANGMSKTMEENLKRVSPFWVSERDIQLIFAEAVLAGRLPDGDAELITGVDRIRPSDTIKSYWHDNPKFQFYLDQDDQDQAAAPGNVSVKAQLAAATTSAHVFDALKHGLVAKLVAVLQLDADMGDAVLAKATDEMGVDSLNAVEIRTWFIKEVGVDVPVLKILGGATVESLIQLAQSKLPADLTPALQGAAAHSSSSTVSAKKGATTGAAAKPTPARSAVSAPPAGEAPASSSSSSSERSAPSSSVRQGTGTSTPLTGADLDQEAHALPAKVVSSRRMSLRQSTFWFLRSYLPDPSTFNIACHFKMIGKINKDELARAVQTVAHHHESLRTCFFMDEMQRPMQGVLEKANLELECRDILSDRDVEDEYHRLCHYNYNLERGELAKIVLLSKNGSSHHLLIGYSHINMDGVSLQVLFQHLDAAYHGQEFGQFMVQFPAYSERQHAFLEQGDWQQDLSYWQEQFSSLPDTLELLPLATVNKRQPLREQNFNEVDFFIPKTLANRVRDACKKFKTTAFHFYLAAFRTLLFRLTSMDELAIGFADAARVDADTMDAIGIFLNLLPVHFRRPPPAEVFADALKATKDKVYAALAHSSIPFDTLLDELSVPRSADASPLFQAFFDFRQGARENFEFADTKLQGQKYATGRTAYDISIDIWENAGEEPHVFLKTQSSLYSHEATEKYLASYVRLIEAFARKPASLTGEPSVFDAAEVEQALIVGRGRDMVNAWPSTIVHRIDEMIAQHPEQTAVKDGLGSAYTYKTFSERAAGIAQELLRAGVQPGDSVAVLLEACADWLCSLFAIMRIGAVYLPLDLRNPVPRNATIVQNAQPKALVTHDQTLQTAEEVSDSSAPLIKLGTIHSAPLSAVPNQANAADAAYILHTSGSTGTPKGMIVNHSSLANEMEAYQTEWSIGPVHVLQQSAFSFDFSIDQMVTGLSSGGSVFVVPQAQRGDPLSITEIIAAENITYTKATPSEYSSWLRYGLESLQRTTAWQWAFAGGERLTESNLAEFRALGKDQVRLHNSYGPAEITVSSHKAPIDYRSGHGGDSDIPAGFSLPNYATYIVDKDLRPVPIGHSGEVLIGGAGPARGYLNLDDMTRAKFIDNPFAHDFYRQKGWERAYRTGDYGHLRPDGALIFERRLDGDTQVKLRGLRIELGDIESTLIKASKGAISDAVVTVRGDPQFLVAHVVFAQDAGIRDQNAFLQSLVAKVPLPEYMVPAMVIPLERMPLNVHLKTDRRAVAQLPLDQAPAGSDLGELSDMEQRLKDVWGQVLSRDAMSSIPITKSTQFFQLGGNSILLPRLQVLVRKTFDVALPLIDFVEAKTLGGMAAKIASHETVNTIDWQAETTPTAETLHTALLQDINKGKTPATEKDRVVILSGATGFLGRNVLAQLAQDASVAEIHCVAVRDPARISIKSDKIHVHEGDLTKPLLGMSLDTFKTLAETADAVIHTAAMRAFWESYHTVKSVNYHPTRTLAALAAPRRVPFLYTSSAGVFQTMRGFDTDNHGASEELVDLAKQPPTDGSSGYVASKWASEAFLMRVHSDLGLPVHLFRTLPLRLHSPTDQNVLKEYAHIAGQMRLLPVVGGLTGTYDVIGVADVARTIVQALGDADASVQVSHLASVGRVEFKEMESYVRQHASKEVQYKDMDVLKWIGQVKANGSAYQVASQDLVLEESDANGQRLRSRR